jgi:zinc transport system substrate-binding protein
VGIEKVKKYVLLAIMLCCTAALYRVNLCAAADRVTIAVSVAPQAYFVERVGGRYVDVEVIVPSGANHETYEPTSKQLVGLSRARILFLVGTDAFPFENRISQIIRRDKRGIDLIRMSEGAALRGQDPHLWVSPGIVRTAAHAIFRCLSGHDPLHGDYYRANLDSFLAEIDSLDREIKQLLSGKQGACFIVYHPAWGYFADEYGLRQLAIEEEGKAAGAAHIRKMIDLARQKGIRVLFVQKGYDTKSAASIAAEIGGKVVETDPLASDWPASLRSFAKALSQEAR